jgi:25S rRNA (uracil2634-N3)-methyltransferase
MQLHSDLQILLVGEGNLSFSASLCESLTDASLLTATCYDSESVLNRKYPDAQENIELIRDYEGTVLFGIDATRLHSIKSIKSRSFDRIIFNFPHAGAGIKDQDRNILVNQKLLLEFFTSAVQVLADHGFILVTLKQGMPYDEWKIKKQAQAAGLATARSFVFSPQDYPGYQHRRTLGFTPGISQSDNQELKACRTFCFVRQDVKKEEENRCKRKKRKAQEEDDE